VKIIVRLWLECNLKCKFNNITHEKIKCIGFEINW